MINNNSEILSKNINKVEDMLMEFIHKIVKQEKKLRLDFSNLNLYLVFYYRSL